MAMPGMLLQLAKSSPMMGQIKQIINTIRTAQNPQMAINALINNNPMMKQAMDIINQYGGDPQKAFYDIARQKGIDPQEIMDMLK